MIKLLTSRLKETMMNKIKYIFSVIYSFWMLLFIPLNKLYILFKPWIEEYKKWWISFTHDKYGDFIYKKAVVALVSTIFTFYVIFGIIGFICDLTYYNLTKRTETIYLSDSVELDSDENLWSAKGCPTKECNSNDALYFRIKNTWFNNMWNIFHHGKIFLPDITAAGITTGQSKCEVISYGLRYRILMIYNIYPQILQVNCQAPE